MINKNVSYVKVEKGNMLFLVPTKRDAGFGMNHEILWSLKELDFKVFGYLDANIVIAYIMREKAIAGLPFYDIEMNMYDPMIYPDTMEDLLKNTWNYVAMRLACRYFNQLISNPAERYLSVSIGWDNNTQDALQIYPLNDEYQKSTKEFVIQFSSYITKSESFIERLIIEIGKCNKLEKDYEKFTPITTKKMILTTEHLIKNHNNFFLLKNGKVYCGLTGINMNILYEIDWMAFVKEMIQPIGCQECNPGYKMKICLSESIMDIFEHFITKAYCMHVGNDCWSTPTQFINIIQKQWNKIVQENPGMEKIVFRTTFNENSKDHGYYIILHYLDKDWQGPTKEIKYVQDGDYILQNKEEIANLL